MKNRLLWGLLLLSLIAVPALYLLRRTPTAPVSAPAPLQTVRAVPDFTLTDETGRSFTASSLRGRVWIADFIFTSCAGACPQMSARMAGLQQQLPPEIHLVSITVDPARDTPPVLKRYAARYGADPGRWHFLTGPEPVLRPLIQQGFLLSVAEGGAPEEPIVHSQRFVLVDRNGTIRGYYDSTDASAVERLSLDARSL